MAHVWIFGHGKPRTSIGSFGFVYNWAISSYAPDGDVLAMTDAVMGTWSYSYDDMNRLTSGTAMMASPVRLLLPTRMKVERSPSTTGASAAQPQLKTMERDMGPIPRLLWCAIRNELRQEL